MEHKTLPSIFIDIVKELPNKVALRKKEFGIWNEYTWQQYKENVEDVFYALKKLGVKKNDRVAVISENRPEWMFIELAVEAIGGMTIGLYVTSLHKEMEYILNHSGVEVVICEDQEQTDKILEIKDKLPHVRQIVTIDVRGMSYYNDPSIISWDEMISQGAREDSPITFEESIKMLDPEDGAVILYTSGTTGNPKGVVLSHKNIITISKGVTESEGMTDKDEVLAYLPMAWVGEKMFSLFFQLQARYTVNFPEDMNMNVILQNLKEIRPSVFLFSPPVWESFASKIQINIDNSTYLKRLAYNIFMPIGEKIAAKKLKGEKLKASEKLQYFLGELFVYGPIRELFGLNYGKQVYTGGAAIGPEIFTYFHALGLEVKQVYGQTEICGIAVIHPSGEVRPKTVGKPIPGVEIKVDEKGEVLFKSEGVFKEYFRNDEATEKTKKGGWLHTGDQGYIDDSGQLVIVDRAKDIFKLKNGKEFSPQLLENRLKFSPYIKQSVIVGDGRETINALIQIDLDNVGNWAQKRQLSYTTFNDLSQKTEVKKLIKREIEKINSRTEDDGLKIRNFWLFPKELDPDDNEITRTNKIRRDVINNVYSYEINNLYSEELQSVDIGVS